MNSTKAPTWPTSAGDHYVVIDSPLGALYVGYGPDGVVAVQSAVDDAAYEAWHAATFGITPAPAHDLSDALRLWLHAALRDEPAAPIPISLRNATDFQKRVLAQAAKIPSGHTRSYAEVARRMGDPYSYRAVGRALATNPVLLLIPCHRVVMLDGVGGYALGVRAKLDLLAAERDRRSVRERAR